MHSFARKPNVRRPAPIGSTKFGPTRGGHSPDVNTGRGVARADTAQQATAKAEITAARPDWNFSRTPVHAPVSERLQKKLKLGTPGDVHEQEADRVADEVMRMPTPSVQSKIPVGNSGPAMTAAARIQMKATQGGGSGGIAAPSIVHDVLCSPGQPLDAATRAFMEPRFKQDFGHVRVHADAQASRSAATVNAMAYTMGHDIVFGAMQFAPHSAEGRKLLAHELAHVSQNSQGIVRRQMEHASQEAIAHAGPASNDENSYEIALALSDFNPTKVRGYDDFKKRGSKYKPFKWYNYMYYEMPPKPFSSGKLLIADDWVFANTATGKALQDKVLLDKNYKPTENELRQLAVESGSIIEEKNTNLGAGLGGNFDFLFEGRGVDVNVKVKFKFESDITPDEQRDFKRRFFDSIEIYWTYSGVGIDVLGDYPVKFIPINITAAEVSADEHKIVDVERTRSRSNVIYDMNIALNNNAGVIAHEFGHVLGLYDEYRSTGWNAWENLGPWKRLQYWKDTKALMNSGTELRARYFTHFLEKAQSVAPKGVTFKIKMPK